MNVAAILTAGFLGLSASWALAEVETDKAIEYRQGVYRAMEWNLSQMAAMVQGRVAFDATDFASRSDRLAFLGGIVEEGFTDEGSARGESVKTRASYRIWQQPDAFEQLMAEMQDRSQAVQQAAAAGQERDELRPLLGRLAQSCKACHDKFRD